MNAKAKRLYIYGAVLFTVSLISTSFGIMISATSPNIPTVIEPGSMVQDVSYVVFTDGADCYAKNGETGKIEFSGAVFSAVVQAAINELNATLAPGTIFIKKNPAPTAYTYPSDASAWIYWIDYAVTATITLHQGISLVSDGVVLDCRSLDAAAVYLSSSTWPNIIASNSVKIQNFLFLGTTTNVNAIALSFHEYAAGVQVENVVIRYFHSGILCDGAIYYFVLRDSAIYNSYYGFRALTASTETFGPNAGLIDHCDFSSNTYAINITGGCGFKIQNCWFESNNVSIYTTIWTGATYIESNFFQPPIGGTGIDVGASVTIIRNCDFEIGPNRSAILARNDGAAIFVTDCRFIIAGNGSIGIDGNAGNYTELYVSQCAIYIEPNYTGTHFVSGVFGNSVITSCDFSGTGGDPAIDLLPHWAGNSNTISQCHFNYNEFAIRFNGYRNRIINNVFDNTVIDLTQVDGAFNYVEGNQISLAKIVVLGGNPLIYGWNIGITVEGTGFIAVTGANSTVTVNHSLSLTPTVVIVTANNTGAGNYSVSSVTSTQFVISFTNQPGTSEWLFYWYAKV